MDNSWLSNSSSTGFVYFHIDTTPSKQNSETEASDYFPISDRNPSPQTNRFNPSNYSSPQNFRRGTPRNIHKRGWKQNYGNRSFSPNTSYNSSYNSPRNRSRENSYQSFNLHNASFNRTTYSSFLEDPWARLEKEFEQKKQSESSRLGHSSDSSDCDDVQKNKQQAT